MVKRWLMRLVRQLLADIWQTTRPFVIRLAVVLGVIVAGFTALLTFAPTSTTPTSGGNASVSSFSPASYSGGDPMPEERRGKPCGNSHISQDKECRIDKPVENKGKKCGNGRIAADKECRK